jgi:hypothetical protein
MEKPMSIPLDVAEQNGSDDEKAALQDVEKVPPARPQPMKAPEA